MMSTPSTYGAEPRRSPPPSAHAHIMRGTRIATVFLETLDVYDESERIPKELMEEMRARQDDLVTLWIEVNENE